MLQYTPQIGIMCVLVALYTSGVLVEKSCTGYIPINGIYVMYIILCFWELYCWNSPDKTPYIQYISPKYETCQCVGRQREVTQGCSWYAAYQLGSVISPIWGLYVVIYSPQILHIAPNRGQYVTTYNPQLGAICNNIAPNSGSECL